ncbi:hypothetical protein LJC18_02100 [Lachnospiraceae bacterium OttesenSCG-928-E19]|nr:hypothetical protein [Lachnospiraceae bacterium OttesenSCG-928-E19]
MRLAKISLLGIMACLLAVDANALEYENGNSKFKLTAMGTIGAINPDFEDPLFINDWRVRGEYSYAVTDSGKLGLMYSMDASSYDSDEWARDAFVYYEDRSIGRFEIGLTDSVAKKMGLGLPDVGGLRINAKPLFYKKINPHGNVISDVSLNTDNYVARINYVSMPSNGVQYGLSVAGLTDHYDFTTDASVKIRRPVGKTKTAYAFGLSFMSGLDNYRQETYSAPVTADWRAQFSASMNLQYNSWIWGVTARAIYDQDPIGPSSDGFVFGTGVSYDLLKYTVSASYLLSETGVWDDTPNFTQHTGLVSFRYIYSQNVDMWMSLGITRDDPFFSVGLRGKF